MKNVAIYKPLKIVYFVDDKKDTAAWSYEVANVAKILAERGQEVDIISDNDLTRRKDGVGDESECYNIFNAYRDELDYYDRIIVWSGLFSRDKEGEGVIKRLRDKTDRLDFMYTDMRLGCTDYSLFDNIYSQATHSDLGIGAKYGGVAEFLCYKHEPKILSKLIEHKGFPHGPRYYFGGTERNRLKDFLEYVWRPDCQVTGKSDTLHFDTRVDRHEYMELLDNSRYSIVIADEDYNEKTFITPRFYENAMHDIVSFCDYKWDFGEHIVSKESWLRVTNYVELRDKMKELDDDHDKYIETLLSQRKMIKKEYISGDYVYSLIK
jgi:hypothetical protein